MLMLIKILFISTLVFCSFDNTYSKKICSDQEDCMTIPLCPEAQRLIEYRKKNRTLNEKFKYSICGITRIGKLNVPMVCCSDFEVINRSNAPTSFHPQAEDEEIDFTKHTNIELLPKVCGIHVDDRIQGGQLANLYEFSWMALISFVKKEIDGSSTIYFGCGGSIINSRYILTAAQCVDNRQILGVRLGEYDISSNNDCQGEYPRFFCENHKQDVEIDKKIIHENYHLASIPSNNIALLRVKDEINLNFQTCKEQDDCMTIPLCPEAQKLAKYRQNNETVKLKFIYSICGTTRIGKRLVPMICCSDFEVKYVSNGPTPTIITRLLDVTETYPEAEDDEFDYTKHKRIELLPKVCGVHVDDRILGGQFADLYEFPWMALITLKNNISSYHGCGGSIINSRYILTAAHCLDNQQVLHVSVGEYDINTSYDCQGEYPRNFCENHLQHIEVEKQIVHDNYHLYSKTWNDIALLRVKDEINFAFRNVAPICLPVYQGLIKSKLSDKIVTVAGWGLTETGYSSSRLLKVSVPILSDDRCDESDKGKIICAGGSGNDSCAGDSGGPLMLMDEYNTTYRMVQYGIVSRGPKVCSNRPNPGIYTDVRKYMRWILDNIVE